MDILLFTSSLGAGGAEKLCQRLANVMSQRGHQVAVAVARQGGRYESDLSGEVELLVLSEGWIDSSTWRLIRSVRPLRRYLSEQHPDIVLSFMDHVNVRLIRAVKDLNDPPPVVLSVHNNPQIRFGGDAGLRNRVLFWRMKRSYPHADRIVSVSKGVAKQLKEMGLTTDDQACVIYNATVDEALYKAKQEPLRTHTPPENAPLLLACGSLTRQKGYPYLLEAFRDIRDQRDVKLWILGEGDKREEIEEQIRALSLEEDVMLLGFRENPFKFMAAADVFVLSSLWEGFGNVIVEAMACGAPVVATDCPYGPGEIISHEENGLLVPPANAGALSEAVGRLLEDKNLRGQFAEHGRERAQDFHAKAIGEQYLDLCEEVVADTKESTSSEMISAE